MVSSEPGLFSFFLLLTALLRSPLFTVLELDHDVSTYLVMANEWLHGSAPFTFYIDVKPIGIYGLFALVIKLFGHNEFGVRIAGILFITLTSFFIYKILKHQSSDQKTGIIGGILYVIMISLHKWSWASNTELFFVFFSTWGLYLLIKANKSIDFVGFGLVMGLGFVIKYHVLFDFAAFGLFYMISKWKERGWVCVLRDMSISFIALLLPFALCHLYYLAIGSYDAFLFASFEIPSRYSNPVGFLERIGFFGEFLLSFLPFAILIAIAMFKRKLKGQQISIYALWFAFAWIAIFMTGKRFFHYYIQSIPVLALFSAIAINALLGNWLFAKAVRMLATAVLLISSVLWSQTSQLRRYKDPEFRMMYKELKNEFDEDEKVYIQQANILYFLFDKRPMQRYVHNSLMFNREHIRAFGIENDVEYSRIMDEAPEHLIMPLRGNPGFEQDFMDHYEIEHFYSEDFVHWSRKRVLLP